jgi:hypothetical protein
VFGDNGRGLEFHGKLSVFIVLFLMATEKFALVKQDPNINHANVFIIIFATKRKFTIGKEFL